jgi:hypothetical protein
VPVNQPSSTDSMVPVNQPSSTDSMVPVNQPSSTDSMVPVNQPSSTDSTDSIALESDKLKDESSSADQPSNAAIEKPVEITNIISPTNTNPSIQG